MDLVDSNYDSEHISKVMIDTTMEIDCICFKKSFMQELIPVGSQ